jgi:hypothetical protein
VVSAAVLVVIALLGLPGAADQQGRGEPVEVVDLMDSSEWQLTKPYRSGEMWSFRGGVAEGTHSWIGHNRVLGDFVLEGEFLYNGRSQGGIVLRGDADSWQAWASGYELDIDSAGDTEEGHIHFPVYPQPGPGEVRFPIGQWQSLKVVARGDSVTVVLNGEEAIRFEDDRYRYGQICLEGEPGGVQYRHLRVTPLDRGPPAGPRSPWEEVRADEPRQWEAIVGTAAVRNGLIILDGREETAAIQLKGNVAGSDVVEIDVWRHDREAFPGPFTIRLRSGQQAANVRLISSPMGP